MDIKYTVFSDIKRIEIEGDPDKYSKAMKVIGARKTGDNRWSISSELEQNLITLIEKLGGIPEKQKTVLDKKPRNRKVLSKNDSESEESEQEKTPPKVVKEIPKPEAPIKKPVVKETPKPEAPIKKPPQVVKETPKVEAPIKKPLLVEDSDDDEVIEDSLSESEESEEDFSDSESDNSPVISKKRFTPPKKELSKSKPIKKSLEKHKVVNSPILRKKLLTKEKNHSPEYQVKYNSQKIKYYKSLGKKHFF
jgi:hypothetical protein